MSEYRVSLLQYFKYLEGNVDSRVVYEGEAVFHAGHVILCGRTESPADEIHLFGLCLQTSAISSDPHQIKGVFKISPSNNEVHIEKMMCSCKAGQGGRCKHISAVLLWCNSRFLLILLHAFVLCLFALEWPFKFRSVSLLFCFYSSVLFFCLHFFQRRFNKN